MAKSNTKSKKDQLGRLKSLGISHLWQTALLLPSGWDDFTKPVKQFHQKFEDGENRVLIGRLAGTPQTKFDKTPRLTGNLTDDNGQRIGFSLFGDTRDFAEQLKEVGDKPFALFGRISIFNNRAWLNNVEMIDSRWLGKLRPRYPGKPRVIKPETVRDRVLGLLEHSIPPAANWLADELSHFGDRSQLTTMIDLPGWPLESLLSQAHVPQSLEYGQLAQEGLETLASFGIIRSAMGNREIASKRPPIPLRRIQERLDSTGFDLTDEQKLAAREMLLELKSDTPMRRVLLGDVGTGKTIVYALACAAAIDGGGKVAVLLPNLPLAKQVAADFKKWWPDIPSQVFTGDAKQEEVSASLVFGTTALLTRLNEDFTPDLLVVDEQQKFSREQREMLAGKKTHLLEVSATCIPRSQALIRYGVVKVSKLTKPHTPKDIKTRIWDAHEKQGLFEGIKETISKGEQVLIVYPLREKTDESQGKKKGKKKEAPKRVINQIDDRYSVEEAEKLWEKAFPGRVRYLHGKSADKNAALTDMKEGKADILVATTVVEVGINLPRLMRVVVIHPDRFGLSTLHQIRGRVARLGGVGYCDLFLPKSVKEDTRTRLEVLVKTQNGFEVAEYDMILRGVGDLSNSSSKQSGADDTFLFGRAVRMELLDKALAAISH